MAKTIPAGTQVKKGYYFSTARWSLTPVEKDGAALPGGEGESYLPVPLPVAIAAAPLMGAAFLMFLPLIGFVLVAHAASRPVARLFHRSATELAASVQPGWQPGEAHLTGKRPEDAKAAAEPKAEDELARLEREIAEKRGAR